MISLLITILVALLVVMVICWCVNQLELPANIKQVAIIIVCLIFLLWVLSRFTGIGF